MDSPTLKSLFEKISSVNNTHGGVAKDWHWTQNTLLISDEHHSRGVNGWGVGVPLSIVNPAVTEEILPQNSLLIANEPQLREVNGWGINVPLSTVNHPMTRKNISEDGAFHHDH